MTIRRRVVVRGVVQGVGFRVSLAQAARTRGVAGSARNRGDGAVEAVLEGEPEAVGALVDWCRRGPRGAAVEAVEVADEQPQAIRGFEIA